MANFFVGELRRFVAAVVAAGWDVRDMRLSQVRFAPPLMSERICGIVTVIGGSGWSRSYPITVRRRNWVSDFERDLMQEMARAGASPRRRRSRLETPAAKARRKRPRRHVAATASRAGL